MTPLGMAEHRLAWRPTGEIGSWVVHNHSVLIVEDTLFVHGGSSAKFTAYSVEDINDTAAEALNAQTRDRAALIHDPLGPQWYRGLLREPCAVAESGIDGVSPSIEGIKANHNGRVIHRYRHVGPLRRDQLVSRDHGRGSSCQ